MSERITIKGTDYTVVNRKPVTDLTLGTFDRQYLDRIGARGYVFLVKSRNGSRMFRATEYGTGQIGQPIDTHSTVTGRGVR
jgi:hypothetical protein